ncbi:MAG: alkaline phosphatase PhoX, partial [Verrucomicrobiota bacterium]
MKRNPLLAVLAMLNATSAFLSTSPPVYAASPYSTGVPAANPRIDLVPQPNVLSPGLALVPLATGTDPLENPSGVITHFGYLNDFPPQLVEATKTEPDENTYLVLDHNPGGPAAGYDYGRHFLFQGHELFSGNLAYVTRINLEVTDPDHRITLLTPVGPDGLTHLTSLDGSTWNPHTKTLLFTEEAGGSGGVVEITPDWPPAIRTFDGSLGKAGYEGIHPDNQGNLLICEDSGGTSVNIDPNDPASPKAGRNPNSFVYRFVPKNADDLSSGKLQALQVSIGEPVKFVPVNAANPTGDVFSQNQLNLHTLGTSWPVRWVTVHDTEVDGTAPFSANTAAKAAGATPFKRPENAVFQPNSDFKVFYIATTGDTDARAGNTPSLAARGAWGSILRVDFRFAGASGVGRISIAVLGDGTHAAFDNLTFLNQTTLIVGEDRGDKLHTQLNALDSVWAFDLFHGTDARILAEGRDAAATVDAHLLDASTPGFQNDGDNETTGLLISNGDSMAAGLHGTTVPGDGGRFFFTQQHGDNTVFEIVARRR